jgi:sugar/nucleoside kinase (ribokinase family)
MVMAKVLGIGNALVDILTRLESDDTLMAFRLPKGSMQLVDQDFSDLLNQHTSLLPKEIASGGSAANTIHGLAKLGIETAFIGKVGKDLFGRLFREDMLLNKINPLLFESETPTGKAIALISPDSERTFATCLGAAIELTPEDLVPELFEGYDILHIEGYLVQNRRLIEKGMKLAKDKGLRVSLDLASYNVVEANIEFLREITQTYVDIVFANEEEAKSFTGKEPEEAVRELAQITGIAIVKTGHMGSLVQQGTQIYRVRPIAAVSIDTTGAGDLYAAGFIYGLLHGLPLDKCGNAGSLLAGKTIEVIGPKMTAEKWEGVYKHLQALQV